jgi:LysR family hydrogen peroxide-inducible transcriptional activator
MTITQLEYALAVQKHGSFAAAARHCFVTQPTLSIQIQKLEEEFGIRIFQRSQNPVQSTPEGIIFLEHAASILQQARNLRQSMEKLRGEIRGELILGIIPTIAPYLLPLFLDDFLRRYPAISLKVREITTGEIVQGLHKGTLHAGILATPLGDALLTEIPLYYEELLGFIAPDNPLLEKEFLEPGDISCQRLWMLEEGHCMRSQILNLCAIATGNIQTWRFEYSSGSLETLRHLVMRYGGATIIPQLACLSMDEKQKSLLRKFINPSPVREIGLILHKEYADPAVTEALSSSIRQAVPATMHEMGGRQILAISTHR